MTTTMNPEQELRETIGAERFSAALGALTDQRINSPGANLIDMADSVLVGVDEIELDDAYPEDRATEVADGAVPTYTATILAAVAEDMGLAQWEPEVGPAFDGSPTPVNICAGVLYVLASNIAHARLQERQDEAEDDNE